VKHKRIFTWNQ